MLRSVDLPEPDGPMMATDSCGATSRSTPRNAWTGAALSTSKDFQTDRNANTGFTSTDFTAVCSLPGCPLSGGLLSARSVLNESLSGWPVFDTPMLDRPGFDRSVFDRSVSELMRAGLLQRFHL